MAEASPADGFQGGPEVASYDPSEGYPRVVPCLHYDDPAGAVRWIERVLGAREVRRSQSPDGRVDHVEIAVGSDVIMVGPASSADAAVNSLTLVIVDDADAAVRDGVDLGGTVLVPLTDQPFGLRQGIVADPGGHRWEISQVLAPRSAPVFDQVNLIVEDMDAAVAFYRRLGLELPEAPEWPVGTGARHLHVTMPGGTRFELDTVAGTRLWHRGMARDRQRGRTVVNFALASDEAVDSLYAALIDDGYEGLQPPHLAYWGSRFGVVADPDGHHVGLMGPMDETRSRPPVDLVDAADG